MRKRKRVLAVLLTGCMLGTMMTGCMKQSSEGDSSNKKKEAVKVPEGLWDPYEDTVTISTPGKCGHSVCRGRQLRRQPLVPGL